jgi:hypothetical protein
MTLTPDERIMERSCDLLIDYILEREKKEPGTRLYAGRRHVQELSQRLNRVSPFTIPRLETA